MRLPTHLCGVLFAITRLLGLHRLKLQPVPVSKAAVADKGMRRRGRRGLTLVEMMVSVTLTLVVVFALVQVFDLLGDSVTDSKAIIEISANLRTAADLLRDDLDGLTVTTLPPRAPAQGEGYLEIVDGPSTDRQNYVVNDQGVQLVDIGIVQDSGGILTDNNGDGFLDTAAYDTSVGDVDDVIAFTTRRDSKPYTGMISHAGIGARVDGAAVPTALLNAATPTRTLTSREAEIVWWLEVERTPEVSDLQMIAQMDETAQLANAVSNSVDSAPTGGRRSRRANVAQRYPNGTPVRSLHRRVLLIRPDLDLSNIILNGVDEVATFASNNDISVRFVRQSGAGETYRVEANSLGDLTMRHNRAFRTIFRSSNPLKSNRFAQTRISDDRDGERQMLSSASLLLRHGSMKNMFLHSPDGGTGTFMMRRGQDVVLSDVLAFDVQVWDPAAPIMLAADGATTVTPSDPGFPSAAPLNARGAYVDLGFGVLPKYRGNTPLPGLFGGLPHPKSRLPIAGADQDVSTASSGSFGSATYCTWCDAYEHDGYNSNPAAGKLVDEGTNGFDDDGVNGVDDPGELETMAPYPHPLRGIDVKLRVMDFATRQIRQSSVTVDFLPE